MLLLLGVVVLHILGATEPLVVGSSVGEVAGALALGGGKQNKRSNLVVVQ